jgi:hypothetical protein
VKFDGCLTFAVVIGEPSFLITVIVTIWIFFFVHVLLFFIFQSSIVLNFISPFFVVGCNSLWELRKSLQMLFDQISHPDTPMHLALSLQDEIVLPPLTEVINRVLIHDGIIHLSSSWLYLTPFFGLFLFFIFWIHLFAGGLFIQQFVTWRCGSLVAATIA